MRLRAENTWTWIEDNYPKGLLDPVLSFLPKGYFFKPQFKKGLSDGRTRLIQWDQSCKKHRFPTGLLKTVLDFLDQKNWKYSLEDLREFESAENCVLELHDDALGTIRLDVGKYAYQGEALRASLSAGSGVVQIGTGGGKSEIGAAIIASYDQQTVWLTHRENLAHQARARLQQRLQRPIGLLGDGVEDLQQITVAMVQTVNNVFKAPEKRAKAWHWLMNCKGMIGDEIHHVDGGSQTWYGSILNLPAKWRIGLSATPKLDGEGLFLLAVTGPVLYSLPSSSLVDSGVLVPPRIWFITCNTPKIPRKAKFGTYYSEGIVNNMVRHQKIIEAAKVFAQEKKSCIVLVKRINHGKNLTELLRVAGLRAAWIHGNVDQKDREKYLADLWANRLDTVVAIVETMGEGTDLPPLRAIINATASSGGGDSSDDGSGRGTIQIFGRGGRSFPGKEYFEYVDFVDMMHRRLIDASKDRINTLEAEGYGRYIKYWDQRPVDGQAPAA